MRNESEHRAGQQALRRELVALLPRLRRYACALAGSMEEGDELLQAACERVLEKGGQRGKAPLDRWAMRVTRNLWIDHHRARQRRAEVPLQPDEAGASIDGARSLAAATLLEQVRGMVAQLPWEQRDVLALVAIEGYSYRDAAAILDVPMGTVMSRLARARAALADRLQAGGRRHGAH